MQKTPVLKRKESLPISFTQHNLKRKQSQNLLLVHYPNFTMKLFSIPLYSLVFFSINHIFNIYLIRIGKKENDGRKAIKFY